MRFQEKVGGRRGDNYRKVKFKQYSSMYLRIYENSNDTAEGSSNIGSGNSKGSTKYG
jgi:hypothetical protein